VANLNKKELVLRIITPPKRIKGPFWTREYKLLNDLLEEFPNLLFWEKVNFKQDWDSLLILKSPYGRSILDRKYKEFHHKLPEEKRIVLKKKSGKDKTITLEPKTIRGFLS
jgi:hypothetical protein